MLQGYFQYTIVTNRFSLVTYPCTQVRVHCIRITFDADTTCITGSRVKWLQVHLTYQVYSSILITWTCAHQCLNPGLSRLRQHTHTSLLRGNTRTSLMYESSPPALYKHNYMNDFHALSLSGSTVYNTRPWLARQTRILITDTSSCWQGTYTHTHKPHEALSVSLPRNRDPMTRNYFKHELAAVFSVLRACKQVSALCMLKKCSNHCLEVLTAAILHTHTHTEQYTSQICCYAPSIGKQQATFNSSMSIQQSTANAPNSCNDKDSNNSSDICRRSH